MRNTKSLPVRVHPQPDDTTCGPTCLEAVYRFHGVGLPLRQVIEEVAPLETGGTLAVNLAHHALRQGFRSTIYTYNLQVFDPTWFAPGVDVAGKLREQERQKDDPKLRLACRAYREYLALGGRLAYRELTPDLIGELLEARNPVLTGLSATYLYGSVRERGTTDDDVRGDPVGHFVIVCGYDRDTGKVSIADPHHNNPRFRASQYEVGVHRLLGAIFLGILTYDANLLVLEPA